MLKFTRELILCLLLVTPVAVLADQSADKPFATCTDSSTGTYYRIFLNGGNPLNASKAELEVKGPELKVRVPVRFGLGSWITYRGLFTIEGHDQVLEFSNGESPTIGSLRYRIDSMAGEKKVACAYEYGVGVAAQ